MMMALGPIGIVAKFSMNLTRGSLSLSLSVTDVFAQETFARGRFVRHRGRRALVLTQTKLGGPVIDILYRISTNCREAS